MNQITLKADGSILADNKTAADPLTYLSFQIKLDATFTLRSYFLLLHKYPLLTQMNLFFPASLQEYQKCPESGCTFDDNAYLELSKAIEMIGYPGDPRLEIYSSLKCNSGSEKLPIRDFKLEHLLDLPLRLGNLKHIIFGDHVDALEFDTVFNLFEFIDSIIWELSFHGTLMECELRR
jgi:hypothetical protein